MTIISPIFPIQTGTTIITSDEYSPENTYVVPRSQNYCFPFMLTDTTTQIVITCAHNRYQGSIDSMFNIYKSSIEPSLRAWPSQEPIGKSITGAVSSVDSGVNLGEFRAVFCFYDINLPTDRIAPAAITRWIDRGQQYYMNVQNRENKDNSLYLKIDLLP